MADPDPILFYLGTDTDFSFSTSCLPEGYRISAGANFNPIEIIGRSSPILTYSGSGSVTLDVALEIHEMSSDQAGDTTEIIQSFIGLTKPETPGIQPPSLCYITIPGVFKNWACVLDHVDPQGGTLGVWNKDGKARHGIIGAHFTQIEIENTPASKWLKFGDFQMTAAR